MQICFLFVIIPFPHYKGIYFVIFTSSADKIMRNFIDYVKNKGR